MSWTVEILDERVEAELAALPDDMLARFVRIVELIEGEGLPNVGAPHVKHLQDKLWEIRVKAKSGISRAIYVTASEQRVIVVRVFIKKTQKTPRKELKIALERAAEIE